MLCRQPICFLRVHHLVNSPLWDSQLHQVFLARSWLLPLLPDIHSEPPAKPFVLPFPCVLYTGYSEVAKTSMDIYFYLAHDQPHVSAVTAGSQFLLLHSGHPCLRLAVPTTKPAGDSHTQLLPIAGDIKNERPHLTSHNVPNSCRKLEPCCLWAACLMSNLTIYRLIKNVACAYGSSAGTGLSEI